MTTALTIRGERQGYTILAADRTNVDGAVAESFTLPSNLGDCLVYHCGIFVGSIATLMTTPELQGPSFFIADVAGTFMEFIGNCRWTQFAATGLSAYIELWHPRLIRSNESFYTYYSEVDTNATPTDDTSTFLMVQRLRAP